MSNLITVERFVCLNDVSAIVDDKRWIIGLYALNPIVRGRAYSELNVARSLVSRVRAVQFENGNEVTTPIKLIDMTDSEAVLLDSAREAANAITNPTLQQVL